MGTRSLLEDEVEQPIERKLIVKCLICNMSIECAAEEDPWAWVKGDAVTKFKAVHIGHGNERTLGAELVSAKKE